MRHVVGYDRNLATQFFFRTFQDLAPGGQFSGATFSVSELRYVAQRLSETVMFSLGEKLGSPWCSEDAKRLVNTYGAYRSRYIHDTAEALANQLLVFEGVVSWGGLDNFREGKTRSVQARNRKSTAQLLYLVVAQWINLTDEEKVFFRTMSEHVEPWVKLLALIPGNDYLEHLVSGEHHLVITH